MRNLIGIKPQDILLMMKVVTNPLLQQKDLANLLSLSQSEVSHGLQRLKNAKLMNSEGQIIKESCIEFLVHAVKFICPAQIGAPALGIPTAFAHPEFKFVKYNPEDVMVWPHPEGKSKGASILPIYPTLPHACREDKNLYKLACYLEMVRSGRVRERKIGSEKIQEFIEGKDEK